MCTAIFVIRLLSFLLVSILADGLQHDQPEGQKITVRWPETKSSDPDPKMDGRLWTPEISIHLLSLVEVMNEKMVSFDSQMTIMRGYMEQRFNNLEDKIKVVASISADLENRIVSAVINSEDKLKQQINFLSGQLETQMTTMQGSLTALERSLNDKIASTVVNSEDKLRQELNFLKEIMKYKPTDNHGLEVSMLGIGQELHKFGNFVVSGVQNQLGELAKSFDDDKKEMLDHFKNVTGDLGDKVNDAAVSLEKVSVELSGRVNESLVSTREEIVSDTRELVDQITDMTGPLIEQIKGSERLSQKLDDGFDILNNSLRESFDNIQLGFDGMSSKVDRYGKVVEKRETALSSCVKGMEKRSAKPPYPHPIVFSNIGTEDERQYLCDTNTAGGGWILIQHRSKGNVDFYRGWEDYKQGFGALDTDFWLGLDTIHRLTSSAKYELRVDLRYKGQSKFAHYASFSVASEADNYRLSVSSYDGTAGDSFTQHDGEEFSTKDRDNESDGRHCAKYYLGAWWYNSYCLHSNLNGKWGEGHQKGPNWYTFMGHGTASFTEMKIRRL